MVFPSLEETPGNDLVGASASNQVVFPSLGETPGNDLVGASRFNQVGSLSLGVTPGDYLVCCQNQVVLPSMGTIPGSYLVAEALFFCAGDDRTWGFLVRFVLFHCGAISESGGGCKGHVRNIWNIWIGTFG